eukprot:scaffold127656_cov36-Phaeocystis_antarctica.AAC.1
MVGRWCELARQRAHLLGGGVDRDLLLRKVEALGRGARLQHAHLGAQQVADVGEVEHEQGQRAQVERRGHEVAVMEANLEDDLDEARRHGGRRRGAR